ncbi:MAG: diguanylate cyclase [Synergistaceae bacterium]|jgi:diguanylate cyclase (GGDEF)-like protein|nr:diguanylate cyclase [Synergistaceae bacterium]
MGLGEKRKILVVDDEKSNLAVLNQILSMEYTVLTARSGEEALKRVEADSPDLILLDIIMPGMDGFQVLVKLKGADHTKNIPVIVITGLSGENNEERGFFLGAVDYITKPFKNAIVKARVRTHMMIVNQMRTIERLGLVDPLTDISNRRSFDDRIDVEWRRCTRENKPISFLMMDIDKFKTYNDTYGHPQGDILLQSMAKLFCASARRPADIVARLGGEEFGILLPETTLDNALAIAEKIRQDVESLQIPTSDGQTMTSATISIGVASIIPGETDIIRNFIEKADEYLYAAKNSGRNRVCSGSA